MPTNKKNWNTSDEIAFIKHRCHIDELRQTRKTFEKLLTYSKIESIDLKIFLEQFKSKCQKNLIWCKNYLKGLLKRDPNTNLNIDEVSKQVDICIKFLHDCLKIEI